MVTTSLTANSKLQLRTLPTKNYEEGYLVTTTTTTTFPRNNNNYYYCFFKENINKTMDGLNRADGGLKGQ
jgi:hypothetical protein